jgi:dTMP kinase
MEAKFITFEGPEGSGKSTACKAIVEAFFSKSILSVREPGSTPLGEKVRNILQSEDMPDRSELLLFEAARASIVDGVIVPALESGRSVLCDRFYDSTTAYQGYGRGVLLGDIKFLNRLATNGLDPDLTILFDIDPVIGMQRRGAPTDRIEAAGMDFHHRVRAGYWSMAEAGHPRWTVIDASKTQAEVVEAVISIIESRFGWKRG